MRDIRKKRTGKEKLIQNYKAKKGMQLLHEEGRLCDFVRRDPMKLNETNDWKRFYQKSKKHAAILNERKPDIVEKLNTISREENEKERRKKEKEKEGEWIYNGESGEYYCRGEKNLKLLTPVASHLQLKRNLDYLERKKQK